MTAWHAVGQVTTYIQAYLTVACLAVGQVVLEAWPLLPGHSLNLLPGRLLHLLVPGQVEDTPGPIGYAGCYGLTGRIGIFCDLDQEVRCTRAAWLRLSLLRP